MGLFDYFKKSQETQQTESEVKIDAVCFDEKYCKLLVANMYSKIMHECADRANLPDSITIEAYEATIYDAYSPAKDGLIRLVVEAMANRKQRFYEKTRLSNGSYIFNEISGQDAMQNEDNIRPDVIELDFTHFYEAEILCLLFDLLGEVQQALSNGVALSQALIFKIHALSEMIENSQNLEPLTKQLEQLQSSLNGGSAGYVDAKSSIENGSFDVSPSKEASEIIYSMICYVTGIPASYLFSDVVGGLGDMSNSEERRLNVAIKRYFNSILRGVLYAVFDRPFTYKVIITDLNEMISLFTWIETTSLIKDEAKARIIANNTALDLDDMTVGQPEETPPAPENDE